ncbi:MAG: hypothetical protein ABSH29_19320 [Acidimicrobiales bacterium]|jgi:hypothetical protein
MHKHKSRLRSHLARAAAIGFAGLTASLVVGAGVASAATPPDPTGGANPVAPHFYNGNVEGIRDSGSDTTFFMMQRIGDLYTGAGLYGCTLNSSAGQTLYNSSDPASTTANEEFFCASGANTSTTDTNDNWDRTEVTEGVDDVGSGAGQNQLCSALSTPLTVDFARSSKPSTGACGTEVQTGYAKDGVPIVDYPINPDVYGTSTTAPYSSLNGGVIGDVAHGWLPGDNPAGPYSGTTLGNISNVGGAASTAYRLWCATDSTRITDWGQLTNLGPNIDLADVSESSGSPTITGLLGPSSDLASGDAVSGSGIPSGTTVSSVSGSTLTLSNSATASGTVDLTVTLSSALTAGNGYPIGIPIRIVGVNTASGTEATFASYAESGVSGGGCSSNMDTDAALDPNPVTATGDNSTAHIALENNSDQLDLFAKGDFPNPDYVDQAIEVATSLYIESNGVINTNPYAGASTIDVTSYAAQKVEENGSSPTTSSELTNSYPTARTLFNIYLSNTVRASTGGFLNWICDSNTNFSKGLDNSTGLNFDAEMGTLISTTFGFPRLTDESSAPATSTPADNIAAPNNTCAASLPVNTTSGSDTITLASGTFPPDIVNAGGLVGGGNVGVTNADFPAGTTVVSGAGTGTLTLSANATATGTGVSTVFAGVPAVTSVANPQT